MKVSTAEPLGLDVPRFIAGLCLGAALLAPQAAFAQTTGSLAPSPCARYGEGFVPVAGSNSCVRLGGHVRVDGAIATAGARSELRPVGHSYVRAPSGWTGLYPR
ncbi:MULTISPECIES: hypothetical protein [Methylosinus]|uniref:Porin n=1 Tax=Methylosinus trichosporium (strain ATCC 35070 / NCIMB 11131 / UNIQEM 75 / OB3b) TaxID=595536 RepID=A0A2D2D3F4_METT3|nr:MULTISPECIES: hypothetical protein [Methylosinus]ATQ69486.1 hypothetical protein CQW49_17565 [Methylosinus trichosporium OB3b]OBS51935.1 hypothetical protein A8B73_13565 [Methylosinus sp. 3S-1]